MSWPDLASPNAADTALTLRLWSQVVGKTVLACTPPVNHWWNIAFHVTARGLSTPLLSWGSRTFEVEFDLVGQELAIRHEDGSTHLPLRAEPLESFWERYFAALSKLGVQVAIYPVAVEIPETIYLDRDQTLRAYDPDWSHRFVLALLEANRLLTQFRSSFLGKVSPVHFFWGSFDLAVTRFSGRPAPLHPGGVPHCPDYVAREAYSHEVSSAGFWPGDARLPEPSFYSYAYPEPPGFSRNPVLPPSARYVPSLGEFVLPYDAVRTSRSPDRDVLSFLETTYAAAADLGRWERSTLERRQVA